MARSITDLRSGASSVEVLRMQDDIKRLQDAHIRDLKDQMQQLQDENDQLTSRVGAGPCQ